MTGDGGALPLGRAATQQCGPRAPAFKRRRKASPAERGPQVGGLASSSGPGHLAVGGHASVSTFESGENKVILRISDCISQCLGQPWHAKCCVSHRLTNFWKPWSAQRSPLVSSLCRGVPAWSGMPARSGLCTPGSALGSARCREPLPYALLILQRA